jgi:hypothetical protein
MTITLPLELLEGNEGNAAQLVRRYFTEPHGDGEAPNVRKTGALFDGWDTAGSRSDDRWRFTADDVLAVSCLSVQVPPRAAWRLLKLEAQRFAGLLQEVGEDRDLVGIDPSEIKETWPAWKLHDALRELPEIGWVTAGKLLAHKRPRLLPPYDSVVREVVGAPELFWRDLCVDLRAGLQERLLTIRSQAGVGDDISPLRIFDVVAWMVGKRTTGHDEGGGTRQRRPR